MFILEGARKMGRELRNDWWKVGLTFNGSIEFSAVLLFCLFMCHMYKFVVFCI